jgi:hypothetical protein
VKTELEITLPITNPFFGHIPDQFHPTPISISNSLGFILILFFNQLLGIPIGFPTKILHAIFVSQMLTKF